MATASGEARGARRLVMPFVAYAIVLALLAAAAVAFWMRQGDSVSDRARRAPAPPVVAVAAEAPVDPPATSMIVASPRRTGVWLPNARCTPVHPSGSGADRDPLRSPRPRARGRDRHRRPARDRAGRRLSGMTLLYDGMPDPEEHPIDRVDNVARNAVRPPTGRPSSETGTTVIEGARKTSSCPATSTNGSNLPLIRKGLNYVSETLSVTSLALIPPAAKRSETPRRT